MARNKLSESRIPKLPSGLHSDGDGLYIRVQKTGSRNWLFIYRRGDKRQEMGLGGYGRGTAPVNLTLAREKADAIRQQLAKGENPRPSKVKPTTFAEAAEALIKVREQEWTSARHAENWRMTLRDHAKALGALPVGKITTDDIVRCLEPHLVERHDTAHRLRFRIAAVLDYAKARGLREGENPAQWNGLLENLLPARKRLTQGHHAATPYASLPAAIGRLRAARGTAARAVEFIALTASRLGEVQGMVWSELEGDLWSIPAARTKMARPHEVPLSDRAQAILKGQREVALGALVFGGYVEGKPIAQPSMVEALRRATGDKSTLHGLRSSFRDWAGDCTTYPREVAEAALAHTVGNETEAAYRRGSALEKRRQLMTDWATYLSG